MFVPILQYWDRLLFNISGKQHPSSRREISTKVHPLYSTKKRRETEEKVFHKNAPMAFLSEVRGRFFYCSHNLGSPEAEMISFSFHFLRCGGEKIFEKVKLCDGRVYARWTNGKRDGGLCFSIPLHKGFLLPLPNPLSPPLTSYE